MFSVEKFNPIFIYDVAGAQSKTKMQKSKKENKESVH